jgi:ATP-binding cassette subfamily F protein uup
MAQPNVLLLDEPTNDLDIPTLIALEEYLDDFAGALVVVSHDRYFLDRTIDTVFKFEEGGKVREFPGNYSAYLEITEREAEETRANDSAETRAAAGRAETAAETPEKAKPQKLSFKEKRELEALEAEIPETEARLAEIDKELLQFATDAYKLNELVTEQAKLNFELETKLERWTELAERADL